MIKTKYKNHLFHGVNIACMFAMALTPAVIYNLPNEVFCEESGKPNVECIYLSEPNIIDIVPVDVVPVEIQGVIEEEPAEFIELDKTMYTTSALNIREEESTDSEIIDTVAFSKEVEIEGYYEGSDWYKVTYDDKSGYMYSEYLADEIPAKLVSSTAYWDEYNRPSASGRKLKANHSLAGMVSWLGKTVELYKCNSDGSIGKYMGLYTFDDTGYGAESGVGSSKILKGRSIGTIENGTCVDIYMDTYSECVNYGRHNVYIRFVD